MDSAVWLRSLGLEQYEAAFRENAIDLSVLPDLTDQDLEKLGVLLGHRRKLQRAIGNPETTAKAALGAVGAPVAVDTSWPPRRHHQSLPLGSHRRTPLSHSLILRSGGLDQHFRAARCRGVA